MKIGIEARALSAKSGGIKMYVEELLRALSKETTSHEFHVVRTSGTSEAPFIDHIIPLYSSLLLSYWVNVSVPKALKKMQPDVMHFTKADVPKKKKVPTVVTIYDIIPLLLPESQSFTRRFYWPKALERAAHQSDHVVTISEASKQGIVEHLQVSPEKVTVTHLAANMDHFRPTEKPEILEQYGIQKPYILFVGTRDQRKNIAGLLSAFKKLSKDFPHQLIIVGKQAFKDDDTFHHVAKLGIQERVTVLENVSHADLPVLYSGADVFVWPSVYEGFGLPPLEAMACGTPVIVSNGGSLPEVVGTAGEVVSFNSDIVSERLTDGQFVEKLTSTISLVLSHADKRSRMRAAGLAQAQSFSWKTVAQKTLAVYQSVV